MVVELYLLCANANLCENRKQLQSTTMTTKCKNTQFSVYISSLRRHGAHARGDDDIIVLLLPDSPLVLFVLFVPEKGDDQTDHHHEEPHHSGSLRRPRSSHQQVLPVELHRVQRQRTRYRGLVHRSLSFPSGLVHGHRRLDLFGSAGGVDDPPHRVIRSWRATAWWSSSRLPSSRLCASRLFTSGQSVGTLPAVGHGRHCRASRGCSTSRTLWGQQTIGLFASIRNGPGLGHRCRFRLLRRS